MTHAALKDLIYGIASRVEQASKAIHDSTRWDEEEMEDGVTISDWIFAPAIAALSAAEGEADELLRELGLDPSRFRTEGGQINAGKVRAAIKHPDEYSGHYTAPPPQQAEKDWPPMDGAKTANEFFNPTPSPGPQGASYEDFVRLATDPNRKVGPQGSGEAVTPAPNWCRACGKHWSDPMAALCRDPIHRATPPAHQPGEVGEAIRMLRGNFEAWKDARRVECEVLMEVYCAGRQPEEEDRRRAFDAALDHLTAALTPKEAGHG